MKLIQIDNYTLRPSIIDYYKVEAVSCKMNPKEYRITVYLKNGSWLTGIIQEADLPLIQENLRLAMEEKE